MNIREYTTFGMLTIGNVEAVAERLERMLTGKKYTFAATYGYKKPEPEVRTDQQLENGTDGVPFHVYYDNKHNPPQYAGFNVCDTYGIWGASTFATEDRYDPEFKNPYIVFEGDRYFKIVQRAPAGHINYWVIAVQDQE